MTNSKLILRGEENSLTEWILENDYTAIFILADAKSNGFCVPVFKQLFPSLKSARVLVIPSGEDHKTLAICNLIWTQLATYHADKKALILGLGGGMITDITGLTAALYKRGIDYINIPTTLLAMVDAAHGGKTAVDFDEIKNMIGLFHFPKAIYINPIFLHTLPERILRSGIAEMIKHVLISDISNWEKIKTMPYESFVSLDMIQSSIEIKTKIVAQDPEDRHVRQSLNFGHSMGHAIESMMLHTSNSLLHGEAIMIGMQIELKLSMRLLQMDESIYNDFVSLKNSLFPSLNLILDFEKLMSFLIQDKKNNDKIRMTLLSEIGQPSIQTQVSRNDILSVLSTI